MRIDRFFRSVDSSEEYLFRERPVDLCRLQLQLSIFTRSTPFFSSLCLHPSPSVSFCQFFLGQAPREISSFSFLKMIFSLSYYISYSDYLKGEECTTGKVNGGGPRRTAILMSAGFPYPAEQRTAEFSVTWPNLILTMEDGNQKAKKWRSTRPRDVISKVHLVDPPKWTPHFFSNTIPPVDSPPPIIFEIPSRILFLTVNTR